MKIKGLLIALTFLGFANLSTAQVDATLNPLRLIFGSIGVSADIVLTENLSVEASLAYGKRSVRILGEDLFKYSNFPITLVGKYYFNPDDGGDGFYSGLFARYVSRSYEDLDSDPSLDFGYSQTRIGIGITAGYKIVSKGGVVFDIGFGAGRALADTITYNDDTTQDLFTLNGWNRLMLITKLSLGYRFGG